MSTCRKFCFSWPLVSALLAGSAAAGADLRLTGLVSTPNRDAVAIVECRDAGAQFSHLILSENQRDGDLSMVRINASEGSATVLFKGREHVLRLSTGARSTGPAPTLVFERASLEPVLAIYAELTGRTLLRRSLPPATGVDLVSRAESNEGLAEAIRSELARKEIVIRPHLEKFSLVAADDPDFNQIGPELWETTLGMLRRRGEVNSGGTPDEAFAQQGQLNFLNTDPAQVLMIYQELGDRTVVRPSSLPLPTVRFRNVNALTRTEAVYALNAVLALNRVSVTPVGDDLVLVYPTAQARAIRQLLDRKPVVALDPRTTETGADPQRWESGPFGLDLPGLARIYSELTSQKVEIGPSTPRPIFAFRPHTALKRQVALTALDLLLGANGLAVTPRQPPPGLVIVPLAAAGPPDTSSSAQPRQTVPGVVIDHSPARSGLYIGSPSLAVLTNGHYLASHDFFGPASKEHERATSVLFRSEDRGQTWRETHKFLGSFWANLFVHRGAAYLMGTDKHHGRIVLRRSTDNGRAWSEPLDASSGLLKPEGQFHTAPMPVIEHQGRLWRAFEDASGGTKWGERYMAGMLSVPVDADLLQAANWTFSNFLRRDASWLNGSFGAWLEGNAVVDPSGQIVNVLRVQTPSCPEKAAIVEVSRDAKTASFDPARDFIDFPGGAKKFTIRFDPVTEHYWALSTPVLEAHQKAGAPGGIRNALALLRSRDLRSWEKRCVLLYHADIPKHGFQYPDWHFDGPDLIAVVRTAYDDGQGGAHNNHDANYLTFHRFRNFRSLTPADSVPLPQTN